MTIQSIYSIINKVKAGKTTDDQRYLNAKKTKTTIDIVAAVTADVEEDRRVTVRHLAAAHGVSYGTMHNILYKSLGLVKKSARWVPKLLSDDQKKERVRVCKDFIAAIHRRSLSMLDDIVNMDKTMVSYHTPETKKQSKQWIKKGQPGPVKVRVHASCTKQMLLVFFDSEGLIYAHIVPKGAAINANYILVVLGKFLEHLRRKRPRW